MPPTFTSTNNSLFATLAAIEGGTAGGYGATNGNALGTYQMGYSALLAIGAIQPSATPKDQSSWVWNPRADFGSSVSDFLSNPSAQNAAAVAYMNILAGSIPPTVSANFGTVQNGAVVTQDGYLLAAWENPTQAPLAATGQSYSTATTGLPDWAARAASGSLAAAVSGFPFPIGVAGYPAGTTATLSNNNNTLTINGPSGQIIYSIANPTTGAGTITFGGNTFQVNANTVQAFVAPGANGQPTLQVATSLDSQGNILSVAQISTTTTGGVTIKNQTTAADAGESDTVTILNSANATVSLTNPGTNGTYNAIVATIPGNNGAAPLTLKLDNVGVSVVASDGTLMYSSTGADSVKASAGQINIDGGSNPAGIGSTRGEVITSTGTQVFDQNNNPVNTPYGTTIPPSVKVQEDDNGILSYPDPTDGTKTDLISPTGTLGTKTATLLDDEGNPVGSLSQTASANAIATTFTGEGDTEDGHDGLVNEFGAVFANDGGSPTNVIAWQNAARETTSLSFTSSTTGAVYQLSYDPQSGSGAAVKVSPPDSSGVQTLSTWSVDGGGTVTANPPIQVNGTIDTSNLQAGQPVAVTTAAGTYHIEPTTGDITDAGAVTATVGGDIVTIITPTTPNEDGVIPPPFAVVQSTGASAPSSIILLE